mgnify:CR=1 FL=1
MVGHHKHCCSYFGTAAIKHETRQQSSSIIGLQLQQPTAATGSYSKGLQLPSLSPGCPTAQPPRSTRGMQCGSAVGNRGDHVGRMSTDTAVCKHNAGPAHLAFYSGETDAATATVTGNTATGAVARGRRRHHNEGGETTELFYQWARAAPRVTSRSVTPIAGAGHGTSRWASLAPALVPGASRSWDPRLD